MTRLTDVAHGRDNNLNLIRMLTAFGVLISQAYPIALGPEATQLLERLTGMTLGHISVLVFFIISGFLIARSFDRSSTVLSWCTARVLRIFPGLFMVLVLTVFVLGPLVTSRETNDYFSDSAINGSLWTLIHEVLCYVGVLLVGVIGLAAYRLRLTVGLALYFVGYVALKGTGMDAGLLSKAPVLFMLTFPFAVGMAFYAWRMQLWLNWWIGLIMALVATFLLHLSSIFYTHPVVALQKSNQS